MLREVRIHGPIHLVPGKKLDEELKKRRQEVPGLPTGPEQIVEDLSGRPDGVPAIVLEGWGKGGLILHTYGYVVKLGPSNDEDFFWLNRVEPFKLGDHSNLARTCLLVHSRWRAEAHPREVPKDAAKSWGALCKKWQRLQQDLADQENVARLDSQHVRYLDRIAAFNEVDRDTSERNASHRSGFAYCSVRPVGDHGSTATSTYAFDIVGRAPERNAHLQISGVDDRRGQVLRVTGGTAVVRFDGPLDWDRLPGRGELVPSRVDVVHAKRREAVEALRSRQTVHRSLLRVLVEQRMSPVREVGAQPSPQLDPSQARAFRGALGVEDLLIVLGPPGTGKTRVITEIASALKHSERGKILMTSYSNKAVDNVLKRRPKDVIAIRLGNELNVDPDVRPLLLDEFANDLRCELERSSSMRHERYEGLPAALAWHHELGERISDWRSSWTELESCGTELEQCRRAVGGAAHVRARRLSRRAHRQQQRTTRMQHRLDRLVQRADSNRSGTGWWSHMIGRLRDRRIVKWQERLVAESRRLGEIRENLRRTQEELEAVLRDVPEVQAAQRKFEEATENNSRKRADALHALAELRHALLNVQPLPGVSGVEDDTTTFRRVEELYATVHERVGLLQARAQLIDDWYTAITNCQSQQLRPELIRYADVIGTTCIGAANYEDISAEEFDLVIMDEAGQVRTSDALIPLIRGHRAVLIGDEKQLPPVSEHEVEEAIEQRGDSAALLELSRKSLLEALVNSVPASHVVQLRTQRRMPEEVARFVSQHFYGGTLQSAVEPRQGDALFSKPLVFVDTAGLSDQERHERLAPGRHKGYVNNAEAQVLNRLAEHYAASGAEWALIVPYRAQLEHLKHMAGTWAPSQEHVDANMGTVDSFQGGERDVVLYGFTRSNSGGHIGFLDDLRRPNVAFTRAKQRLVLVGDMKTLLTAADPEFRTMMETLHGTLRTDGEMINHHDLVARLTALGS
ncbi:energy-coupling factor transporter ATP-binding protein EcfA2 [Actinopolyspora biskrensis]|uniref:Energy-coupling factor transporter ATP-binding protein EcfA2 n=1 Tax=Actinopolyspora biskrensis TaxID=1470178 RepID=A0A852YSY7_9ACTN|nr:AAA domain-containing protein [Actinopolyspora biskrensis]NYH77220.1 energy-coupling factor transporter ATP-binding protein EcfA2 [Actinopolyspora biskrensis]